MKQRERSALLGRPAELRRLDISGLRFSSQAKLVLLIHSFLVALSPHLSHAVLLELVSTHLPVGVLSIFNFMHFPLGLLSQRHTLA